MVADGRDPNFITWKGSAVDNAGNAAKGTVTVEDNRVVYTPAYEDGGKTITVTVQPSMTALPSTELLGDKMEFTVTVAKQVKKYNVVVDAGEGGSADFYWGSTPTTAGQDIILEATADEGYHLYAWGVVPENVTLTTGGNRCLFTMPAQDVEIKALFEPHSYTWQSNHNGTHTGSCDCGDETTVDCIYDANGICTVCGYQKPMIQTQPQNATVTEGSTATFDIETIGDGQVTYQWELSTDNGVTWTKIDGATAASYTTEPATLSMNGYQYRCVVSDPSGNLTSDVVTLTVNKQSYTGTYNYEVTVDQPENGTIVLADEDRYATAGEKITITVEPDEGYAVSDVTVTTKGGKDVAVTDNGDGTYSFTMPSGAVTISATFVEAEEPAPTPETSVLDIFNDLVPSAWYIDAVQYAYDHGLMTGTSATTFSPNATTTRGMIVAILHRQEGEPVVNYLMTFDDVAESAYYAEAVRWAASEGVVNGYSASAFGPGDAITREQLAAILYNYAAYKGMDTSARADLRSSATPRASVHGQRMPCNGQSKKGCSEVSRTTHWIHKVLPHVSRLLPFCSASSKRDIRQQKPPDDRPGALS